MQSKVLLRSGTAAVIVIKLSSAPTIKHQVRLAAAAAAE